MLNVITVLVIQERLRAMINNFKGKNLDSHLDNETVKDVKFLLIYSGLKQQEIADFKGIPQSTVAQIKCGDIYANIDID